MTEEIKYEKPIPRMDEESKPFWEACARHELYVQKCRSCGKIFYYPRSFCPEDLSQDFEWIKCSKKGKVYTFTVTQQNQSPGFRNDLPYILAYVELEEGVRLLTNIVNCEPKEVKVGMLVELTFVDASPEISIHLFQPSGR